MATLNYAVNKDVLRSYKKTKMRAIIEEFMDSDSEIVELMYAPDEYKNPTSAANNTRMAVKRMNIGDAVRVALRNDRVFLYKE